VNNESRIYFKYAILVTGSAGFIGITGVPFVDFPTWFALTYKGKFVYIHDILGYWRRYAGQTTNKLWLTEREELRTYYFINKQYISFATFIFCSFISLAKYLRRLTFWKVLKKF